MKSRLSQVPKLLLPFFLSLCVLALFVHGEDLEAAGTAPRTSVKLLTIGNSFADNALACLPQFAKADGKQLVVLGLNLSSCSLEHHVEGLKAFDADPGSPKGRLYKGVRDPGTGEKKDFSLREALESQEWDVVTIQQLSTLSYKPETYQPYANTLIDYVRKYAPKAEILIFETWAYREDCPLLKKDNLDQATMYAKLKAAYQKLAEETGLRLIPVGDAFQAARALPRWQFAPPADGITIKPPENTSPQGEGLNLPDARHANIAGKYLAAAAFYEVLFNTNVEENTYVSRGLTPDEARTLRRLAHEAIHPEAAAHSSTDEVKSSVPSP